MRGPESSPSTFGMPCGRARAAASAVRAWLAAGVGTAASLAFPWECPVCGADDEGRASPFCDACRAELVDAAGRACERCASPVGPYADVDGCRECRGRKFGFDGALALGPYQGPLRSVCLMLKREPEAWLGRWLAELLVEARPELKALTGGPAGAVVAPVPLHWRRWWSRGYNQADELAGSLSAALGLRLARPLKRVRDTEKLAGLGRVERAETMRGAFRVRRNGADSVRGRTVLLVDDVLTTGSTCGAAARALKAAGAKRVIAVVVGRASGRA